MKISKEKMLLVVLPLVLTAVIIIATGIHLFGGGKQPGSEQENSSAGITESTESGMTESDSAGETDTEEVNTEATETETTETEATEATESTEENTEAVTETDGTEGGTQAGDRAEETPVQKPQEGEASGNQNQENAGTGNAGTNSGANGSDGTTDGAGGTNTPSTPDNTTQYHPADTDHDGVVSPEEGGAYISPDEQKVIDAGYHNVVECSDGSYRVLVHMDDEIDGYELICEYLKPLDLEPYVPSAGGYTLDYENDWYCWYVARVQEIIGPDDEEYWIDNDCYYDEENNIMYESWEQYMTGTGIQF